MKEPLYRDAIRHSWQFAWHNKVLWGLGLFAGALGQMGILDFFLHVRLATENAVLISGWGAAPFLLVRSLSQVSVGADVWIWAVWLLTIGVGLLVFFVFTAVVSQGTLIQAVGQSVRSGKINLDRAWHTGVGHFWRLFWLNVIRKVVITGLAIVVGWAALNALIAPTTLDLWLFLAVSLLAMIVGPLLSLLTIYAAGYMIVEEYDLFDACVSAWLLFREHWLVSVEVAALLLFFHILAGLIALAGVVFFFFPTMFIWLAGIITLSSALFYAGFLFGTIVFVSFVLLVAALYSLFATSTWTYLFMKMHRHGVRSRILHWWGVKRV